MSKSDYTGDASCSEPEIKTKNLMAEKTETQPKGSSARSLWLSKHHGILSTHSLDLPGYPFGSVTPYCLDREGYPVILISDIAQHTKNILANPKVSLTITEGEAGDVQTQARLTYIANAERVEKNLEDAAERYYNYFPASRNYHRTHSFLFFRLLPVRGRFIGGFGQIFWLEPGELVVKNAFSRQDETSIITHMNKDHVSALKQYGRKFKKQDWSGSEPVAMVGIDGEGFDLVRAGKFLRFSFQAPIKTLQEARQTLVSMARPDTT